MKPKVRWVSRLVAAIVLMVCAPHAALAQLNENCTVSVLNRNVRVNADGSWVLPNIPANFGPVRARVTCIVDGQTISGESDPFTVPPNGVVNLPHIVFGQTTLIPTSLSISAPTHTLISIGASVQLSVSARHSDGTVMDVSAAGTTYTISNSAIATVTGGGLVQAVKSGTVIIQATQEGRSGMIAVQVLLAGVDTDGDGIPDDYELAHGMNPNNPVDASEDFDRDGLSNLDEYRLGTDPRNPDTDGDGLKDGDEVNIYHTSPLLRDTDGDGISDGLEVQTGSNPLDPNNYNLAGAVSGIAVTPPIFTLTFNTIAADVSVQLKLTGTLRDGTTLDITAKEGTNYASSDLKHCNFSAARGRVFAGEAGSCTITATVGTLSAISSGTVHTFSPIPLSSIDLGGAGNSVDVSGDFAYVAVSGVGLKVVDVANRTAPRIVATLNLLGSANDVKLAGARAYVAAGAAGLHIIDVANPLVPRLLGSVDTPGSANDVRVRGQLAFVADGPAGLQIIDVTDPNTPRIVGSVATAAPANGVDVTDSFAVVAVGPAGIQIVNVTNPSSPSIVGSVDTPGDAQDVVVKGTFAYVADYTGSLRVADFSTPSAPVLRGTTPGSLGGYLSDVAIADSFVFGADIFFVNGVPIVDVSDPNNLRPRAILNFPGDSTGLGIAVDGSYVYLVGSDGRLYIGQYRIQEDLNGIPPTASIASPLAGATFVEGETIPVTVLATDDLAVVGVSLQVNGTTVATDTTAPYQFTVTAPVGATSLTLGAQAGDLGNNTGIAADVVVNVIPDPLTTASGRVVLRNGGAVAGATLTCVGKTGVSQADGSFSISGVRTVQPAIGCTATSVDAGVTRRGVSAAVAAVRGGTTSVGDIVIAPVPIITSITPKAIDASRAVASLQVTGNNLAGSVFSFAPVLDPPVLIAGTAQINPDGTAAALPITVSPTSRGRFTLVGTNAFGGADSTPTSGNTVTVINAQDDVDSDGDGFPDGLELLFGSDPSSATSVPSFSSQGILLGSAFSVVNTLVISDTPQTLVSVAFSVSNTLLMSPTSQTLVSALFSVSNTLLISPTLQTLVSAAFSVSNNFLMSPTQQTLVSAAFSVTNTLLLPTTSQLLGSVFSVLNSTPVIVTGAQQTLSLPRGGTTNPAIADALVFAVRLDRPSDGERLVQGQTITIRANANQDITGVEFVVNDVPVGNDSTFPYELTFTVPSGVDNLTFAASATDSAGNKAIAAPVGVAVEPDPSTTVSGRVVDAAGLPVSGAIVELLSEGLQAEFFDFSTALSVLPDLTRRAPDRNTRVTAINQRNPNLVFGTDPFGTRFAPDYAARFTGWISIATAGVHKFIIGAGEGVLLKVGGVTLVNLPTWTAGYHESSANIDLSPGLIPIELSFYASADSGELQLSFVSPGGERQVVPPSALVPQSDPFVARTDESGRFAFSGVPTALDSVQIRATSSQNGQNSSAASVLVTPVSSSGVNVDDIVLPIQQQKQ